MFEGSGIGASLNRVQSCLHTSLIDKYGINDENIENAILKSHGMSKDDFDFVTNTERMLSENMADVSIDANANKNEMAIPGTLVEVASPINKIVGYRYLYRKMVEMYDKREAKRLAGEMYDMSLALADSTKILIPYCFSLDASKINVEGRKFGMLPSAPPNRLSSYIASLNETVHQISNHVAGAIAVGSFFFDVAHVLLYKEGKSAETLQDKETRKYIENCFQSFVHSVNHLSRNAVESPFTNISLFDRVKLATFLAPENMGWYFPVQDGFPADAWNYYVIEYIMELQRIFMDFFDRGDVLNGGRNFRFPVVTANISKHEEDDQIHILDKKFVQEMSTREIYRYNILVSEGSKVASCCFDDSQKVCVRYENNDPILTTYGELWNNPQKTKYRVMNSGVWAKASLVKVPRNGKKMYKVSTVNNKDIFVTEDHINPTFFGDKSTRDLTTEDYLLFATRETAGIPDTDMGLTYADGVLIGAYLGDGSGAFGKTNQVMLSLNKDKFDTIIPILKNASAIKESGAEWKCGTPYNNVYPTNISAKEVKKFIQYWVSGNSAVEKNVNLHCLTQSVDFRKGIVDGLYMTDGGNSNRIYTTSVALVESLEAILTSIGYASIIDISDRTDEPVIICGEEFKRNHILHCIRFYTHGHKGSQVGAYKTKHNSVFFKIDSIVEVDDYTKDAVYCFEMKDQDNPYFTLPNGIVTHNCRLLNNFELLELGGQMNSFGGSGISLGSHRVVTINFNRVALEATSYEDYKIRLEVRIKDASKILEAHRALIKDFIKSGQQPFMTNGWLRIDRMFSTFGVLGIVEAQDTIKAKFGVSDDVIEYSLTTLNDLARELTITTKNIYNIEQIPGESMAPKLAKIDRMLFGEEAVPYEMYSNQFVPLWEDVSLFERMAIDGKYNKLFTGGGIVHFNLGERVRPEQAAAIIEYAASVGCEHFALNPVYTECVNGHTSFGKHEKCPVCSGTIKTYYTRVVGFFVPVASFNKVRREWEFPNRKFKSVE